MKKVIVAIGLIGALTACSSPQERAQRAAQEEQKVAQIQATVDANQDRMCRSYGAQPGTQVYVDCRLRLKEGLVRTLQANAAQQQAVAAQQSAAVQAAGAALMAPGPSNTLNCTSIRTGFVTNTNCN